MFFILVKEIKDGRQKTEDGSKKDGRRKTEDRSKNQFLRTSVSGLLTN